MKQTILAAAVCALAGCAAPQQTATVIRPSQTGCYYRVGGISLYGVVSITQPRYEPAPCNIVNANQPAVVEGGGVARVVTTRSSAAPRRRAARDQCRRLHWRRCEWCLPWSGSTGSANNDLSRPDGRGSLHRTDVLSARRAVSDAEAP